MALGGNFDSNTPNYRTVQKLGFMQSLVAPRWHSLLVGNGDPFERVTTEPMKGYLEKPHP
jgi:hypothetical protein